MTGQELNSIDGIGPKTRKALNKIEVVRPLDLTMVPTSELEDALSSLASRSEILAWQQIAFLSQVENLDIEQANVLHKKGVVSISDLGSKTLSMLNKVFENAVSEGLLQSVPSEDEMAAMIRDATLLDTTASISGVVLDMTGEPISDAEVIARNVHAKTGHNGRFRLNRILSGSVPHLVVRHKKYATLIEDSPDLFHSNESAHNSVIQFDLEKKNAPDKDDVLDELSGDEIPSSNHYRMRTRNWGTATIREDDVLIINDHYKRSDDVKLVSRYKTFKDGEIWVNVYKVEKSQLPRKAKLRDQVRMNDGKLQLADLSESEFFREKWTRIAFKSALDGDTQDHQDILFNLTDSMKALNEKLGLFRANR